MATHSNPLQYSCLENFMDRGAWQVMVYSVAKGWTWLKQLSTHTNQDFPSAFAIKEKCNTLAREDNSTPLQYSCLENPMDGGAWWVAVHGVTKSRTWLSIFTFTFHFHALEKEMATYSSVLAWRIPGMGKPGELLSMGSHRVRHDWSNLAIAIAIHWCYLLLSKEVYR